MSKLLPNTTKRGQAASIRRFLSLFLAFSLLLTMLSGCSLFARSDSSPEQSSSHASTPQSGDSSGDTSSQESYEASQDPSQESSGHDDGSQSDDSQGSDAQAEATGVYFDDSGIDYDRLLATKNQAYTEGSGTIYPSEGLTKKDKATYTLMIYMTGSNLESVSARATLDIIEMQNAGLTFNNCNVIVYAGGCQAWKNNIPSTSNSVLDLSLDPSEYIIASTQSNADMGAPETLREFINFTTDYFPADHYSLIFWDHGGGPLWGYGADELFGGDSLLLSEMKEAMDQTIFADKSKLDIVGFDACLMGSYEVMSVFSNYAKYMIASEELEPGDGWDYHFLSILDKTSDPKIIGKQILDDYLAYYKEQESDTYHPQITLSQTDLTKISSVSTALESVFTALSNGLDTGMENDFRRIRLDAKSFGIVETRDNGTFYYDLVDLIDLLDSLSSLYNDSCQKAITALKNFVVYAVSTMDNAGGVSLYYPCQNKGQYEKLGSVYKELSESDSYVAYLESTTKNWLFSKSRDWKLGAISSDNGELFLQLTEEQLANVSACYYTLLLVSDYDGLYVPAVLDCRIVPDENGVLHIPDDPVIFYPDETNALMNVFGLKQIEKNDNIEIYQTINTSLNRDINRYFRFDPTQAMPVTITFSYDTQTGETQVLSFTAAQSEFSLGGKESIDFTQWQAVFDANYDVVKLVDRDGRTLPFSQWTYDTTMTRVMTVSLAQGLYFTPVPASHSYYAVQIVIEDTNGEQYATDLFEVSNTHTHSIHISQTENGRLSFYLYSDHAEVCKYEGTDTSITIPDYVKGLPVTDIVYIGEVSTNWQTGLQSITLPSTLKRILGHAFNSCKYLTTINLPDGLEYVGARAFNGCESLETVVFPDSVTYIGDACFDACTNLKSVTLPSSLTYLPNGLFIDCPALESIEGEAAEGYKIINGALYNPEGTVLVAYPAAKTGSFTVPSGTLEIAYAAFFKTQLSNIILPEGITQLGPFAFFQCENLAVPAFPDSLDKIGYKCFGSAADTQYPTAINDVPAVIKLGENMFFLGEGCFDIYLARVFEVDEKNPFFATVDGNLTNKAQDTLIMTKGDKRLNYVVPEGIVSFDYAAFSCLATIDTKDYNLWFNLFIPASVTDITGELPDYLELLSFHSPTGTFAQNYAARNGILWDSEISSEYYIKEVSTAEGVIYARVYPDHAMVFLYIGTDHQLEIPETIDDVPVTVLGNGTNPIELSTDMVGGYYDLDFRSKTFTTAPLTYIKIPDTVTTFSPYCFSASDYIADTLVLPSSLTIVGDYALPVFSESNPLVLPDSLEYLGQNLAGYIERIPISEHTKYINPNLLFVPATNAIFEQISPNDQYLVKDGSLYSKDGKTLLKWGKYREGPLTLPEGIVTIGPYAFMYSNYSSIILPSSLETIQDFAFEGGMITSITFPSNLKTIGDAAFINCHNLKDVVFNEGLTYIGDKAFSNTAITTIVLPESLTYVGDYCFTFLTVYSYLKEGDAYTLKIGPSLHYIGTLAFNTLPVKAYEVDPENPSYASVDGILYDYTRCILIHCPSAKEGDVYMAQHTAMLRNGAFYSCLKVTDIYIPDCVTTIQNMVFTNVYFTKVSAENYQRNEGFWYQCHVKRNMYPFTFCNNAGIPYKEERVVKTFKE